MRTQHLRRAFLMALAGTFLATAAPITPEGEAAAAVGQKWLELLDGQKYAESWKGAGAAFRDQVTEQQWLTALKRSREPLGGLVTRTASRVDFTESLRGAPDGHYCVIHYTTALQNKTITERLTLLMEDGRWQVTAYAIH